MKLKSKFENLLLLSKFQQKFEKKWDFVMISKRLGKINFNFTRSVKKYSASKQKSEKRSEI